MPYTPLPPPPQRNNPTTFADDGDAFLAALPQFGADMEAARLTALDAIAAAPIAVAAANYKGEYSAAVTYQVGQCVSYGGARWYSKTVNTGVTPADGANWGAIRDIPNPAGQAGKVLVTDGSQSQWQPLLPTVYKVAQYTASATFAVPAGVYVIRPYAFGAGAAGTTTASGGGGGCAYGDIAVTPGTSVTLSIAAGVAKVTVGGVDLLTASPASGVTAGTASKHASVANGGAYSGGAGSSGSGAGGASSGSPLGNGSVGGVGGGGGWGGAGSNAAGGGGVGGASSTGRSGDALTVPSTDAILSGLFGSRGVASATGGRGSGGPAGCGGGYGSAGGGAGGFGAGGGGTGGNNVNTDAGEGGFGGGGGGASVSGGYGGAGGFGGGGGRGAAVGGAGGAAVIRIYY